MSRFTVEPAPERAAAGLRLAPALDSDGKLRPLAVAASWNPVSGAASYTLRWWRAGTDSQGEEQPDAARHTHAASGDSGKNANSQDQNQLTVPSDRTGADFTVSEGGWYRVRLRVNGDDGGLITTDENEMEVLSYQRGHVFLFNIYGFAIRGTKAEPVYGGVKVGWHHPHFPSIIKYQYKALHRDEWHEHEERGWTDAPGTGPDTTSYTVTGLEDGETYAVWLQAVTEKQALQLSHFVIVTTPQYVSVDSSIFGETDYDTDDDGLIEIADAHQLNAIRWDLDGDGTVAARNQATYSAAFPGRLQGMGCPESGCKGYEIGTGADGEAAVVIDLDVVPFNTGTGWDPIGPYISVYEPYGFGAILEGNGNVIDNLFINKTLHNSGNLALFDTINSKGKVRNLGLTNVSVTGSSRTANPVHIKAGALAGRNAGLVRNSYSTGTVSVNGATDTVAGGLVAYNRLGIIHTSHSSVTVTASNILGSFLSAGGLVGYSWHAQVAASYATGTVTATNGSPWRGGIGGLMGRNLGSSIRASYSTGVVTLPSTSRVPAGGLVGENRRDYGADGIVAHSYYDSETSGQSDAGKGAGKTTAELQSPTGYTGIYANWNMDLNGDRKRDYPWNFGTSNDYPTLN